MEFWVFCEAKGSEATADTVERRQARLREMGKVLAANDGKILAAKRTFYGF
jgi:hypothetical protein